MTTIAGIAAGDPNFSILVDAIRFIDTQKGTDYLGTLSDPSQSLTVFAPNNGAFAQLAADQGYTGDPNDTAAVTAFLTTLGADTLETVVLYHVAPGVQSSTDIAGAGSITTLQGGIIDAGELPTLGDLEPDLINPTLIATDISADNGVVHVIDRVLLPLDLPGNDAPTITGIVLQSGSGFDGNAADFDILREAVVTAGLAGTLDDPSADFTAFAPTDGAFIGLARALGYSGSDESGAFGYLVDSLRLLNGGNDPVALLKTVLTTHVVGQSLQSSQIAAAGSVTTLQGATLTLNGNTLQDGDPDLPDPALVTTDIQAANGIVHVIDGVLIPVDLLPSDGANDVDFVIDGDGGNFIFTGADNDLIDGKGGADEIFAGIGNDLVLGGGGDDLIVAGWGDDTAKGEDGDDFMLGMGGNDMLSGGAGNDTAFGGHGADKLDGGTGNDRLVAGWGNDTAMGGDGDDALFGQKGNDHLSGGAGHDAIFGGDGNDKIAGDAGNDEIFAGSGNDTIDGGTGNDLILTGWGHDVLVFEKGDGHDVVLGFSAHNDRIDLSDYGFADFAHVRAAIDGGFLSTEIDLGNDQITLIGVWAHQLDADNFIL